MPNRNRNSERGATNFVAIFLLLVIAAAVYVSWVYLPMYLDDFAIRKAVRTACNVAYTSHGQVDPVRRTVMNGWKEADMHDTEIGADGKVLKKPTPFDEQNLTISFSENPPEVTIDISYERTFVMPFTTKEKTKTFTYSHTEDLSPVKY